MAGAPRASGSGPVTAAALVYYAIAPEMRTHNALKAHAPRGHCRGADWPRCPAAGAEGMGRSPATRRPRPASVSPAGIGVTGRGSPETPALLSRFAARTGSDRANEADDVRKQARALFGKPRVFQSGLAAKSAANPKYAVIPRTIKAVDHVICDNCTVDPRRPVGEIIDPPARKSCPSRKPTPSLRTGNAKLTSRK